MAEKKAAETAQKLKQSWYEVGQAVVQSTFDIQNRSLQYAQNCFTDEVETLKSHIEASQRWLQAENRPLDQQEVIPSLMESGIEAYKRNLALLQRITEQGTETFIANAEVERDLTQTLIKKAQSQPSLFL